MCTTSLLSLSSLSLTIDVLQVYSLNDKLSAQNLQLYKNLNFVNYTMHHLKHNLYKSLEARNYYIIKSDEVCQKVCQK